MMLCSGETHKYSRAEAVLTNFLVKRSDDSEHSRDVLHELQNAIAAVHTEIAYVQSQTVHVNMLTVPTPGKVDPSQITRYVDEVEDVFTQLSMFEEQPEGFSQDERLKRLDRVVRIERAATAATDATSPTSADRGRVNLLRLKCAMARQGLQETLTNDTSPDHVATPVTPIVYSRHYIQESYEPFSQVTTKRPVYQDTKTPLTSHEGEQRRVTYADQSRDDGDMYEEAGADFRESTRTPEYRSETVPLYGYQEVQSTHPRNSEVPISTLRSSPQGAASGHHDTVHETYTQHHAQVGVAMQHVNNVVHYVPEPPSTQRTINSAPVRRSDSEFDSRPMTSQLTSTSVSCVPDDGQATELIRRAKEEDMITKGPWELTVWLIRITGKALEHKVLPKSVTEPIEKLITNGIIKVIDYDKITLVNNGDRREYPDPCVIWKQLSDAYNACVPHEFAYFSVFLYRKNTK
jgi:hypothetical protein